MQSASEGQSGGDFSSLPGSDPQFRDLLAVLPAGAYTCDADGLITYFNEQAVQLWGRAPKLNDPADRYCGSFKLYSPDGTPISHDQCWMALAIKNGKSYVGQEIVIERPDGSRLSVLAHANPLRDEVGQIVGAVNVLVDVSDRRRADEAQSRLAAIVESSTDAIVSKTLDGRVTSWNAGAERLFGFSAEEMVGQSISRLIPPDRHHEEQMILDQIRRGERVEHYESVRITKHGERIDVSLSISPIRDSAGHVIGAAKVARDITVQKQANEALRESEQRFAQFMQHLPGLAWLKDLDGRYVFVNDSAERAFQKSRADLYGKRDDEIFPPSIAKQFRDNDRRVLATGAGGEMVETLQHADGVHHSIVSKFPIPGPGGKAVLVGGIAIDITQRKQAEEALVSVKDELAGQLTDLRRLHEMSARLSMVLELQPILEETLRTAAAIEKTDLGVLALCDQDQTELRVGASLGFDQEYLSTIEHDPPLDGACGACFDERRRVIVEDVETARFFAPYLETARRAGFRAVHSTPLITRTGKIVGVLATYFRQPHRPSSWALHLIDLCARQAVDFIENARLYQELREADRRKDEFLATLAHELRNPLAPISNSLQLLRLSDDLSPAVRHIREIMEQQVNHMVRLVDDLLEVARITRGKIELRKDVIDLSTVIGHAVETSRPFIEAASHQLALSFPAKPLLVEADPVRLAQVVANLLNNAAKYTPNGGQIWLTVRRDHGAALVSVRDNGQGIAADMLPRVFEMFAQVDRGRANAHSGLGIGLALAKRLVEMHGGQIDSYSDGLGRGSEFVVRLPLASGAESMKLPQRTVPRKARAIPRRNVLVVDDTQASAYVLGKLFEALGQEVATAGDADAALKLARARRPHVIFSDIAMPNVNGYELARRLRSEPGLEGCTLVALTGYSQDGDRQRAQDAGFDHYLVKPVSIEALQDMLAALPSSPQPDMLHLGKRV